MALTPAEENHELIQRLVGAVKGGFIELGDLLCENSDKAYWSMTGHERFRDMVEQLGVGSYSWVTRIMDCSRVVAQQLLDRETVLEIGLAKMALILPLVKKGKLTDEVLAVARDGPYRDLRQILGGSIEEGPEPERYITCPRCGDSFVFHEDMLRVKG